ncbi:MAG TPA: efflux RND transporter periplasmic adaptor subunit [Burkholderiales bacterium]|jgi:RND family efflux transporter MFP subunit|nr:efflux RND transporter periplasmic adaptor subunit [Burkholderiales bacterium]
MRKTGMNSALAGMALAAAFGASAQSTRVAPVEYREVDTTYSAEAVVEAVRQSTISAQVMGRVVELRVDAGDRVKAGQVIARIDEREAAQMVAGSEAQVAQASADLENARLNLERSRRLLEQKFVSQSAVDRAESEFKAAQARLRAAQAGAGQAAVTRGYTTVVAPFSGVISQRHVEVGEMAAPGKPLFTAFDPADMRVIAEVPQSRVADIRANARAMVEVPSADLWIKVASMTVLPAADPRTHSTRVRLVLEDAGRAIYPGVYARAHFAVGRARKLVVPAEAVLRRSEVTGVYVIDAKGKAQFRQVRLGEPAGDGYIEVLAGVSPSEKVSLEPVKAGIASRTSRPSGS